MDVMAGKYYNLQRKQQTVISGINKLLCWVCVCVRLHLEMKMSAESSEA